MKPIDIMCNVSSHIDNDNLVELGFPQEIYVSTQAYRVLVRELPPKRVMAGFHLSSGVERPEVKVDSKLKGFENRIIWPKGNIRTTQLEDGRIKMSGTDSVGSFVQKTFYPRQ